MARVSGFRLTCVETPKSRGSCLSRRNKLPVFRSRAACRFLADGLTLPEGDKNPIRYQPYWSYLLIFLAALFLAELIGTYLLTKRRFAC